MAAAVVGGREYGEEAAASESLEAVHHALVRTEDEVHFVVFEEGLYAVRAELHDVAGAVRVTNEVRLDAEFTVAISRVAPQDVDDQLLLNG